MPSATAITKRPHFYPFQSTLGSRDFITDHHLVKRGPLHGGAHSGDVPIPMVVTPCPQQ